MPTVVATVVGLLIVVLVGLLIYGRRRRRSLLALFNAIEKEKIPVIEAEVRTRLETAYPELNLDDFNGAACFLDEELRPGNERFLSALPQEQFESKSPDFWVIDVGILVGKLVRRHSALKPDWKRNGAGVWNLCFPLSSGEFVWNPFDVMERHYAGQLSDLVMSLQLVKNLK